ncbi:hypothetical protein [Flavobacterium kingsejongi]|uniref:Uncharacterized protein n=1 Tax=Flavobacterium kingsejongi TaxID=1678728 RepID=A0A2S1LKM6_9FLAO|nr:hypothetical protein [Flavobacterium kingsejongi]AWG24239.1 hypothetical protein FK004_02875 [Flavobacterium kingsejongi]
MVQLNKEDDSVRSIMMLAQGDGSLQSGVDIIITITGIIAGLDPSLAPNGRGEIMQKIGLLEGEKINNMEGETIKNGIKYSITSSQEIGILFAASKP